ncbi:MAG: glycosyltransferase family 2 protein [Sinimarinibacterium sp.]|jgi:GT2 family glycosyltransferase
MNVSAMPAISVILPTHNRARVLERSVRSVLEQTFDDFELIIVDDASTDDTPQLLSTIQDSRIRILRLDANRGAAGARNAGIAAATADWVAFQDSDDVWLPDKLHSQYTLARNSPPAVGLVLGGYLVDTPRGKVPIAPSQTLAGADSRLDLLDGWPIITPTWLVRREPLQRLRGFDQSYPCLEDWDLVFRLSDVCEVRAVPGPVLVKHGSLDSVCADQNRMRQSLERILSAHAHRWQGQPRRLARRLAHLGCLQFRAGLRPQARRSLCRAVQNDMGSPAPYGLLLSSLAGPRVLRAAARLWPRYSGMTP